MDFDFSQFFNPSAWGSWAPRPAAPAGYSGPTGDIGYGTGVGANGPIPAAPAPSAAPNQGMNNLMQKVAMSFLQPQQIQAPQLAMAKPVGPGPMPQVPQAPPQGAAMWGPGMLNRYGF